MRASTRRFCASSCGWFVVLGVARPRSLAAGVSGVVFGGVVAPCGLRADLPPEGGGPLIDLLLVLLRMLTRD